jgi:predicted nucleotidyltransferase
MAVLTESFLQSLVAWLDNANTIGITLVGSFARDEGGEFSDVDIHQYVRKMPEKIADGFYMRYMDRYLVSIALVSLEEKSASLRDPQRAIWAIPGLCQERILLDKDGSISELKGAAANFTWEPLQAEADAFASWNLSCMAEEVHKIIAGLALQDESRTVYALLGLPDDLAKTLLVQRGVLIPTENRLVALAQKTAGQASEWTRQYRLACGLDALPDGPPYLSQAVAVLRLYCETARLLENILLPKDAAIVHHTVEIIAKGGF